MAFAFAALLLDAQSPPAEPAEFVFLPALASNVRAYLGRTIETCGLVQDGSTRPGERVLHAVSRQEDPFWLLVDDSANALPPAGAAACVVGIVQRRAGVSPDAPTTYVADGLQNPDFVLYPNTPAYIVNCPMPPDERCRRN